MCLSNATCSATPGSILINADPPPKPAEPGEGEGAVEEAEEKEEGKEGEGS
jgi:hypothetical protein